MRTRTGWLLRSGWAIALIGLVILGSSFDASAKFGIKSIISPVQKALGGVVRGVGDIFGQGVAGLSTPTIDYASGQAREVVAFAIAKANDAAKDRINQANDALQAAIKDVDATIAKRITDLDQRLDQKLGAADIIMTKAIQNAEDSMVATLRFGALMVLVAALLFVVARMIMQGSVKSEPLCVAALAVAATVGVALGASYLPFLAPPAGERIAKLESGFRNATYASLRAGEFNYASAYAKQLTVVQPTSLAYAAAYEVSTMQRDLLSRPALLRSSAGASELLPRVRHLSQLMNDVSGQDDDFTGFVTEEVTATSAVILWQLARTEAAQVEALCSAIAALEQFQKRTSPTNTAVADKEGMVAAAGYASPMLWLASSYARWGRILGVGKAIVAKCADEPAGIAARIAALEPVLRGFDNGAPPDSIAHVVAFNDAVTKFYSIASPAYTSMLVHDAAIIDRPNLGDLAKAAHKQERDDLGNIVLAAWTSYIKTINENPQIGTTDVGLAVVGLPAALAIRARILTTTDPGPSGRVLVKGDCDAVFAGLNANPPALDKFTPVQKTISDWARLYKDNALQIAICNEQLSLDAILRGAELAVMQGGTKSKEDDRRERMSSIRNARVASLTACDPTTSGPLPKGVPQWENHEVCLAADFAPNKGKPMQPVTFGSWLQFQQSPTASAGNLPWYALVR